MTRITLIAAAALLLTAPAEVLAQRGGGPGFLFERPVFSVGVRAGYSIPRTGGALFDFTLDEFIPSGADTTASLSFDSPYLGAELAFRPWERWDVAVSFGWTRSRELSEYRRWVGTDDLPISQETTFEVVTGMLGAKYYLQDRGRSVGSLAWVPNRLTPFVGAGVGVASYEFVQAGEFVDTSTFEVFPDYLRTTGEGLLAYGTAGVDLTVTKNALITAEARYTLSDARVAGAYVGYDDIDLAGLQLMIGLGFQF
jgi:hypothetical protein